MSYKPLSQTVTDGQNNPISSDAVYDAIDAIPDGANTALSNLAAPTAVNQDLNMGTNQLRFNSSERNSVISLNALDDVATGINAVTPSNAGTTTINTSASITDVLQVGDRIYLDGLSSVKSTVLTKPSATQITVSAPLGAGGGSTSREIYIEPQLLSSYNSTTEQFSVRKDGQIVVQTGTNLYLGNQNTAERRGSQSESVMIGVNAGRYQTTGSRNTYIGYGAGQSNSGTLGTGTSNTIVGYSGDTNSVGAFSSCTFIGAAGMHGGSLGGNSNIRIGVDWGQIGGSNNIMIGNTVIANSFSNADTIAIGTSCLSNNTSSKAVIIGQQISVGNVVRGVKIGNATAGALTDAIVLGYGASSNGETNIISIGGNLSNLQGKYYKAYLGNGATPVSGYSLREFRLTTGRALNADNIPATNGRLILSGALSTGTEGGGPVIIGTSLPGSSGTTLNEPTERMRVATGGQVAINNLSNAEQLSVGGSIKASDGDLIISKPSKGLKIAEGDNATMGVKTLVAGTATVSTTAVKTNSRIMLTNQNPGGTVGFLHVSARTADTSFVITSSNAADTSDIAWMIVNPTEDADASAFISAAAITDATQKLAIIELVSDLKAASLWSKMKAIYPFVGGAEASHKFNLKDPQDTDGAFRLVFSGTWTHNSNGITKGANGYADTKLVPSVDLSAVTNVSLGVYLRTPASPAVTGIAIGVGGSTGDRIQYTPLFSWGLSYRVNETVVSGTHTGYVTPLPGDPSMSNEFGYRKKMHIGSSTTNGLYIYANDVKKRFEYHNRAAAATGNLPTNSFWIGGSNDGGNFYSEAGAHVYSFAFIGEGLSSLEAYTLNSIVENYQNILGRIVTD